MKKERVDADCCEGTNDIIRKAMQKRPRYRSKAHFIQEAIWTLGKSILEEKVEAKVVFLPPEQRHAVPRSLKP